MENPIFYNPPIGPLSVLPTKTNIFEKERRNLMREIQTTGENIYNKIVATEKELKEAQMALQDLTFRKVRGDTLTYKIIKLREFELKEELKKLKNVKYTPVAYR